MNILFVCHGNICRSPMAEYVFRNMVKERGLEAQFPVIDSCAVSTEEIGNPVYPPAKAEMAKHGIACNGHSAKQITSKDFEDFDLILAMDQSNLRLLKRRFTPEQLSKVELLLDRDVADPWFTGNFSVTYSDIVEGCELILSRFAESR